jgi:hypothetical protein
MAHRVFPLILITVLVGSLAVRAEDPPPDSGDKKKSVTKVKDDAAIEQERLANQYRGFELAMLHLAQRLERSNKPGDRERAAILKEAIEKSSEVGISHKFETLIGLLRSNNSVSLTELAEAMTQSKMLADDIQAILDILLSGNRTDELKRERERLEKLIKELERIIREQKVVRAQTEMGKVDKQSLGHAQGKVTKSTEKLGQSMGKPNDIKSENQGQQEDSKGNKPPQPNNNQNQSQQQQFPGRKQVQEAIESQKRAEKEIDKDKKDDASNHQDKAIQKLEDAKKQLEELLRQLREEELQRLLAALEARCRRMLEIQIEVYEGTLRVEKAINQNPDKAASRSEEQRSLKLSDREMEIVREAKKGLELLEAEGSGVAFPEVFGQVRDDASHVVRRLGKADVGPVTQAIEQDIITSLKEMIEALKKAMSGGGGQGNSASRQGNKALIDLLAELKMIRSLQIRVNQRTLIYGRQYPGEQAADPDIQKELANLAQRQQRVFEITNDIARGKNSVMGQ